MIHGSNEDRKIHEQSIYTACRRMVLHLKSKNAIVVTSIGLLVVSAFLLGSAAHSECGMHSSVSVRAPVKTFAYPRYLRHLINESEHGVDVRALDLNMDIYPSKRTLLVARHDRARQEHLNNSKDYNHRRAEVFETSGCKAQYPWQLMQFPTCNFIFEFDMTAVYSEEQTTMRSTLIANGFWRDVWIVKEFNGSERVLKTLRYQHDYTGINYERHRRDALAMERMTQSPHVVDIYGYCGNSGLFQYGTGGDILDRVWPREQEHNNMSLLEKLEIATQVAMAVADLHNFDKEGQASIAHTDITPSQFILVDGVYKLNDFNRARFIRWSANHNKPCGYYIGKNPGKSRSPEEYLYDEQSEKVDVYSMGNIFYTLLTELWPFENITEKAAQQLVMEGMRPEIPIDLRLVNDTIFHILKEAMRLCHNQNATGRASARQVEKLLKDKLLEVNSNALAE